MSIATAITDLSGRIQDAYTALSAKGATMPATKDSYHLSATIDTIQAGGDSLFGVDSIKYIVGDLDSQGSLTYSSLPQFSLVFNGLKKIDNLNLKNRFNYNPAISSISFPELSSIRTSNSVNAALQECFVGCTNLKHVEFPELSAIDTSNQAIFYYLLSGCINLTSISFPKLKYINAGTNVFGHFCRACTGLMSMEFPMLSSITGSSTFYSAFRLCSNLSSVSFPELTSINSGQGFAYSFYSCSNLQHVSFPRLKSIEAGSGQCFTNAFVSTPITQIEFPMLESINAQQFIQNNTTLTKIYLPSCNNIQQNYHFSGCTNLVEIHFALANKAAIEASTYYSTKWGAPNANCQILFDL